MRRFNKPVMSYTYIWDGVFDNRGRYWKRTFHRDGGFTYPPIEAGLPVQRVTAEDRSAYVEGTLENWPGLRREAEEVAALMPDVKPILAGMFVDDEGRLWVERVTPSEAPAFYDRYSEDGDYLGSIRLGFRPARGRFWVQKGSIYTWVTDEMGVPFIVRAPFS